MKIISLLLAIFSIAFISSINNKEECTDFLQELNLKPAHLSFQDCKKVEEAPAVLLKSSYVVSGENAKAIEDFLHKEFGLKRLRFACCGWETSPVTYHAPDGETYDIHMHSLDEFSYQEKWSDYKAFSVTVGKYIVLP